MLRNHHRLLPPLALIFIGFIVCLLNFSPNAILSGWDTLLPEFDYLLNLKRIIFGVFRTEQGLGAVAAHAHMSDLPRIVMLYFFDLILPTNLVRFTYIALTLILGPLGVYYLLRYVFKKEFHNAKFITSSAFLGGLFYMLNLGTLQQFIVPFEMFNALYAFLPWMLLFALKYLYSAKPEQTKFLFMFTVVSLLASPMAYAPALWYMHFGLLILFLLVLSIPTIRKRNFQIAKRSVALIGVTLAVNSFWLLPHIYFLFTHSSEVSNALVNKLFSEQAFLYNKEYGNIKDLGLLKSFLFSWNVYLGNGVFTNLLTPWIEHLKSAPVLFSGYMMAALALFGLVLSIVKRRLILIGVSSVLFFTLFFLFNDNPPFGFVFRFLQDHLPLFKEALRFPHTKLFIHFIFAFSIFFAAGVYFLSTHLERLNKRLTMIPFVLGAITILFFMLPAFRGNYISPQMRIEIPQDYQQLSSFLNEQEDMGKVALLPIHSFWGWDYHDWGYQGAGFIWFNIKQPILHRNFDRWSSTNEQFYREFSFAIYSQDTQKLEQVIQKYNVSYLLIDQSIIAPEHDPKVLFNKETQTLIEKQTLFKKAKTFGKIELYTLRIKSKGVVYSIENAKNVGPSTLVMDEDKAYSIYGNYITDGNPNASLFPLRDIINNEGKIKDSLFKITNDGIEFLLSKLSSSRGNPEAVTLSDVLITNDSLLFSPKGLNKSGSTTSLSLPLKGVSGSIINLNGINSFNVPAGLSSTPLLLGKVTLKTTEDNTISVYNPTTSNTSILPLSYEKMSLRPCNESENIDDFGIDLHSETSFSIFGKGVPLCLTIPFSNIVSPTTENSLFGIEYNININNPNAPSSICIANLSNGNCLSNFNIDFSQSKTIQNSFYYGIKKGDLDRIGLRFFLDTTKNSTPTKVTFNNLAISATTPEQTLSIKKGDIEPANSQNLSDLLISFSGDERLSQDLLKLPKTTGRCEKNPKIAVPNRLEFIEKENTYIRYTTENGSLCDSFSYQNLLQNQGYIALITSRNLNGLPLNICITNFYSKRCDIYTKLSKNKDFTTEAFLLPPMGNTDSGYDVNINNLAIKGTISVNDLKSILFVPFPYDTALSLDSQDNEQKSSTKTLSYAEINASLYKTAVPQKGEILALAYSNEQGWKAYSFEDGNKLQEALNNAFPFIFGRELKEKVLVNNWANGWKSNGEGSYILITYLPQYFEYLGLIATTILILILLSKYIKR